MDTKSNHISRAIQTYVMNTLEDFKIPLKMVLGVITDNASNMVRCCLDINEEAKEESQGMEADLSSLSIDDLEDELSSFEEEEDVIQEGELDLDSAGGEKLIPNVSHLRCAVHTLQLSINDALKDKIVAAFLCRVREVAKAARNSSLNEKLKQVAGRCAILDNETRWGSTYQMLLRLLELKPFLIEAAENGNERVKMNGAEWEKVADLEAVLKTAFVTTKKLQLEDLTAGNISYL